MRIAILVKEFPPNVIGGTETQTRRMARALEERGHQVTVWTKSYPDNPSLNEPFSIRRVPTWNRTPFVSTLSFVMLSSILLARRHTEYDVLQCMMIYPTGFVGYVVSKFTGTPYFAWIRGGDYYFMKDHPIKRWTIDRVFRDTVVLVQTERIGDDVLREFPHATLQVLGNGVDVPEERADGDRIVFVGRLKGQKGVDVLLRALDGLDEQLLVVGDGPERERLQKLADSLDVDAEFVGEVPPDAVNDYLRQGKAFVLPAVEGEGLPNAVLEAMAIGLPVVATDLAGIPDVVHDGENGYVVQPDDPAALQEAIQELCSEDERRERMGENARQYVERNHSWPSIVDRLEEVYARVRGE